MIISTKAIASFTILRTFENVHVRLTRVAFRFFIGVMFLRRFFTTVPFEPTHRLEFRVLRAGGAGRGGFHPPAPMRTTLGSDDRGGPKLSHLLKYVKSFNSQVAFLFLRLMIARKMLKVV